MSFSRLFSALPGPRWIARLVCLSLGCSACHSAPPRSESSAPIRASTPASSAENHPPSAGQDGAHYAALFGQPYRTTADLYLFALNGDMELLYLGRNDNRSPLRSTGLPASVAAENIGRTFGKITVIDVVPAGAQYVITAETHEVTALSGVRQRGGIAMGFIGILTYAGKQTQGVLAEFIQTGPTVSHEVLNQRIDEAIAVKWTP